MEDLYKENDDEFHKINNKEDIKEEEGKIVMKNKKKE